MRSILKGSITFSLVSIPIKVFNAIETSEKISFNQLHASNCLGPIGQKKQCKKCDVTVTNDEIVKGYQYEKEKYVIVAPEEIASITPESSEAIEIIGFIKPMISIASLDSGVMLAISSGATITYFSFSYW